MAHVPRLGKNSPIVCLHPELVQLCWVNAHKRITVRVTDSARIMAPYNITQLRLILRHERDIQVCALSTRLSVLFIYP